MRRMIETGFLTYWRDMSREVRSLSGRPVSIGVATLYFRMGLKPRRAATMHVADRFWR